MMLIRDLFATNIDRQIEEVIKVDQTDEQIVKEEIDEYQLTKSIERHYIEILNRYAETPNKPHEGVGIWISGFFGSGKSSFAKILGLALSDRMIAGKSASERFAEKARDQKLTVFLKTIAEKIPTEAVIFDVSTDKGIRGNQSLIEIVYQKLLETLGYARTLDLAELEIALEDDGKLQQFTRTYAGLYPGRKWEGERNKISFAISGASRVMHEMDGDTYPRADSWSKAVQNRADINAGQLAARALDLLKRRRGDRSLIFVIDEVGQFVARDAKKLEELRALVESFGRLGRGRIWVAVTSQEQLSELVSGLDETRIELPKVKDRFPLQVHLEQSDISEVTSRRVLAKSAEAQTTLRALYDEHRGRLADHTRLTADIRLPELTAESFIDLYPLLPYHIDLIIQIVSGLRTHGGGSRHVGGANRTIIKLAQQLLINPGVNLASQNVGALARIDQIYELVQNNISSDLRAKIEAIDTQVNHSFAKPVAKAVCLLQFVKSVHRTPENIAATLHPSVAADSVLASVKDALTELESRQLVRRGDDGYRIPTPSEDDWDRQRAALSPKPGDIRRGQVETVKGFWQPKPALTLLDTKKFEASLTVNDRPEIPEGDIAVHVRFAPAGKEYDDEVVNTRRRSRQEKKAIFWIVPIDARLDQETAELFRSKEMLTRKGREAKTADETALITEERIRQTRHSEEVRRLLKAAMLGGSVFFAGNDRSPEASQNEVGKAVSRILGEALPEVFNRFEEAAARVQARDRDALLTADNLLGLTDVFTKLALLKTENKQTILRTDSGPLAEVFRRIDERSRYGDAASGKYLEQELAREPFGWEFENVRLFVLALLRAGKIEVTSKSQTFDSVGAAEAKETFGASSNNVFRQATFRPKVGIEFETIARAAEAYRIVFGREVKELEQSAVAREIREGVEKREDEIRDAAATLRGASLPGADVLESALQQCRSISRGNDANAINSFNAAHHTFREAIKRASEINQTVTEPRLLDLRNAQRALSSSWPALQVETDLPEEVSIAAKELRDLMARETFFRDLPRIEQLSRTIRDEFDRRYQHALGERCAVYRSAIDELRARSEWASLQPEQQQAVTGDIARMCETEGAPPSIAQLREQRDLAPSRHQTALSKMMQILEGERLVHLQIRQYFSNGIETEEQLDTALTALRDECGRLIGAGKKILME